MRYRIYQLKITEKTRDIRFISYQSLTDKGLQPDFKNYALMYEGETEPEGRAVPQILDDLWVQFNCTGPVRTPKHLKAIFREPKAYMLKDFKGHSLSISDIVVLGSEAYYVDGFGFKKLVKFEEETPID